MVGLSHFLRWGKTEGGASCRGIEINISAFNVLFCIIIKLLSGDFKQAV